MRCRSHVNECYLYKYMQSPCVDEECASLKFYHSVFTEIAKFVLAVTTIHSYY